MSVDQAELKVTQLTVFEFKVEHRLKIGRQLRRVVGRGVPSFIGTEPSRAKGRLMLSGQGCHPPVQFTAVVLQAPVPRIACVELIGPLAAQANFDVPCHVLEQGMEEHDRNVRILPVPR